LVGLLVTFTFTRLVTRSHGLHTFTLVYTHGWFGCYGYVYGYTVAAHGYGYVGWLVTFAVTLRLRLLLFTFTFTFAVTVGYVWLGLRLRLRLRLFTFYVYVTLVDLRWLLRLVTVGFAVTLLRLRWLVGCVYVYVTFGYYGLGYVYGLRLRLVTHAHVYRLFGSVWFGYVVRLGYGWLVGYGYILRCGWLRYGWLHTHFARLVTRLRLVTFTFGWLVVYVAFTVTVTVTRLCTRLRWVGYTHGWLRLHTRLVGYTRLLHAHVGWFARLHTVHVYTRLRLRFTHTRLRLVVRLVTVGWLRYVGYVYVTHVWLRLHTRCHVYGYVGWVGWLHGYGLRLHTFGCVGWLRLRLFVGYVTLHGCYTRLVTFGWLYTVAHTLRLVGWVGLRYTRLVGYTRLRLFGWLVGWLHTHHVGYVYHVHVGWLRLHTFTVTFVTHGCTRLHTHVGLRYVGSHGCWVALVGWLLVYVWLHYGWLHLHGWLVWLLRLLVGLRCWLRYVWLRLVTRLHVVTVTFTLRCYVWLRLVYVWLRCYVYVGLRLRSRLRLDLLLRLRYVYVCGCWVTLYVTFTVVGLRLRLRLRLLRCYVCLWLVGYGWLQFTLVTFTFGCLVAFTFTVGLRYVYGLVTRLRLVTVYVGYVYVYVYVGYVWLRLVTLVALRLRLVYVWLRLRLVGYVGSFTVGYGWLRLVVWLRLVWFVYGWLRLLVGSFTLVVGYVYVCLVTLLRLRLRLRLYYGLRLVGYGWVVTHVYVTFTVYVTHVCLRYVCYVGYVWLHVWLVTVGLRFTVWLRLLRYVYVWLRSLGCWLVTLFVYHGYGWLRCYVWLRWLGWFTRLRCCCLRLHTRLRCWLLLFAFTLRYVGSHGLPHTHTCCITASIFLHGGIASSPGLLLLSIAALPYSYVR